jgi:3-hydroxyisobutyrate dehydrogenase-like beta-hydroxyacid dehydrogenase
MRMKIGFIGAGVMGGGMARRALADGHDVSVCDLRDEIRSAFSAEGARVVGSAGELGAVCDYVVLSLPRNEDVDAACFGEGGLISSLKAGSVVIDTSSTVPDGMEKLVTEARNRDIKVIDAPLCPSLNEKIARRPIPANIVAGLNEGGRSSQSGNLCFFVGGEADDVNAADPVLKVLGIEYHHVGGHGAGKLVKLLHNAINITALAVISETMVIAKRSGLDVALVVNALTTSLADSQMLRTQGRDYIAAQKFPKGLYPLTFSEKDSGYALDCGKAVGVRPRVLGAAHALFEEAVESPWREYYNPAIFRFIEEEASK